MGEGWNPSGHIGYFGPRGIPRRLREKDPANFPFLRVSARFLKCEIGPTPPRHLFSHFYADPSLWISAPPCIKCFLAIVPCRYFAEGGQVLGTEGAEGLYGEGNKSIQKKRILIWELPHAKISVAGHPVSENPTGRTPGGPLATQEREAGPLAGRQIPIKARLRRNWGLTTPQGRFFNGIHNHREMDGGENPRAETESKERNF